MIMKLLTQYYHFSPILFPTCFWPFDLPHCVCFNSVCRDKTKFHFITCCHYEMDCHNVELNVWDEKQPSGALSLHLKRIR